MKNLVRRTIAVTRVVMASAPFIYLALAIRAFKENPAVIAPSYKRLVDCLDTPVVGRPLELLMKANGVTLEYLHCAQYETGTDTHSDEAHEPAQGTASIFL